MYFIVELEFYDSEENKIKKSKCLTCADGFHEVIDCCYSYYGEEEIQRFLLIEPLTDNSVVILGDGMIANLREIEENRFD